MFAVNHKKSSYVVLAVAALAAAVSLVAAATALALPRGLIVGHYGAKVDATSGANFCAEFSGDTCRLGEISTMPGGFGEFSPHSVGVAPNGNIYVADTANNRVQELTPAGGFVLMFGKEVNETKTKAVKAKGTTPTRAEVEEENVCTQVEVKTGAKCKAGEASGEAGAFSSPEAVAVDPVNGNVYVAEGFFGGDRVDQFTSAGRFVLTIGKGVNPNGGNLCTQVEVEGGTQCQGANVFGAIGVNEHGALALASGGGNEITVGGPNDLLYVGTEHRVQEFKADGTWANEIPLGTISEEESAAVEALAVDRASGDVYLTYPSTKAAHLNTVYEFTPGAEQPNSFTLSPREAGTLEFGLEGIALDSGGHLAVVEKETEASTQKKWFGSILNISTGRRLSEFAIPNGGGLGSFVPGLAFNAAGNELYGASISRREAVGYSVREGAELVATPATGCTQDPTQQGSFATLHCAFNGEVNPSNVSETEAWFQWSPNKVIGGPEMKETTKQAISTSNQLESLTSIVEGLRPNSTYYYHVAAYDQNFAPPIEALTSEAISVLTPAVPPETVGVPRASFVTSDSAAVEAELNPENARTEYGFEYVTQEQFEASGWVNAGQTSPLVSAHYANVAASLELPGLQPSTTYHVRLVARDEQFGFRVEGPESTFTTLSAPHPSAETNSIASAVTATSAIISGSVNPDGKPASYAFELGVYNPAGTQLGTVFTGSAGEGTAPTAEALRLSGLQPATRYAYRIALLSGYAENEAHTVYGAIETFETEGLSSALSPPSLISQLPLPVGKEFHFPKAPQQHCKSGFVRNKHGHQCVKRHAKKKRHGKLKKSHHARRHR